MGSSYTSKSEPGNREDSLAPSAGPVLQNDHNLFRCFCGIDDERIFQKINRAGGHRLYRKVCRQVSDHRHIRIIGQSHIECSVGVNVVQLARMGATLANNGKNPATGEQVIKPENVPHILSTMIMAGLYDGSGGWAWNVGLPAKSGVGGGIVAVVPGKGAIAVFAPPLDEAGNSVKAQKVIEYVANKLDFNLFSPRAVGLKGE